MALVATDSEGQQAADVISVIPEAFSPPLHSILITLETNLSEVLAGGLAVQVDLLERLERGTGDRVRVLGLSEGSTRVRFSALSVETSRDCQTVARTFSRVLHINGSYTQEFISAFCEFLSLILLCIDSDQSAASSCSACVSAGRAWGRPGALLRGDSHRFCVHFPFRRPPTLLPPVFPPLSAPLHIPGHAPHLYLELLLLFLQSSPGLALSHRE